MHFLFGVKFGRKVNNFDLSLIYSSMANSGFCRKNTGSNSKGVMLHLIIEFV